MAEVAGTGRLTAKNISTLTWRVPDLDALPRSHF
jgi:hypothetical protein